MTTRRLFLKSSGLAMFGVGAAPMWLARAADSAEPAQESSGRDLPARRGGRVERGGSVRRKKLLRAAPDHRDPGAESGTAEAAIDLDGFFGLHPALGAAQAHLRCQQLAIVHAVGSPDEHERRCRRRTRRRNRPSPPCGRTRAR